MHLSPEIEILLSQKVQQGIYPSVEFAINEAVSLLEKKENYSKYIDLAVKEGIKDFENGDFYSSDEVKKMFKNIIS